MCQSASLIHRRVTATIAREGLPHLLCAFILSNSGTSWSRFLTRNPREGPADWKGFLKQHGRGKIMTSVYRNVTHMFKDKAWYHEVSSSFLIIFAPRAHLYWQKRHIHVEDILLTINFYFFISNFKSRIASCLCCDIASYVVCMDQYQEVYVRICREYVCSKIPLCCSCTPLHIKAPSWHLIDNKISF